MTILGWSAFAFAIGLSVFITFAIVFSCLFFVVYISHKKKRSR